MDIEFVKKEVRKYLSDKRYYHSECVMEQCMKLAELYGADVDKAMYAGIAHDIAKELSKEEKIEYAEKNNLVIDDIERKNPGLLHGKIGSHMCREKFGFDDDILDAIEFHSTGKENMSLLAKILFVADCTGKDRKYDDTEYLRELCKKDLDAAVLYILDFTIKDRINEKKTIHPNSIYARNYLIKSL